MSTFKARVQNTKLSKIRRSRILCITFVGIALILLLLIFVEFIRTLHKNMPNISGIDSKKDIYVDTYGGDNTNGSLSINDFTKFKMNDLMKLTLGSEHRRAVELANIKYEEEKWEFILHQGVNFTARKPCSLKDKMSQRDFLSQFKCPCWYEKLEFNLNENNLIKCNGRTARNNSMYSPARTRLRCLPYFYVTGAPETVAIELYDMLAKHPSVLPLPTQLKDLNWWGYKRHGNVCGFQSPSIDHYIDSFHEVSSNIRVQYARGNSTDNAKFLYPKIFGDVSSKTLFSSYKWEECNENYPTINIPEYLTPNYIHEIQPDAKIIVLLQNPTDRAYACFQKVYENEENIQQRFHYTVLKSITRYQRCMKIYNSLEACAFQDITYDKKQIVQRDLVWHGLYQVYLHTWLHVFPKEQLLVVKYEDIHSDPQVMETIYKFLDLDYSSNTTSANYSSSDSEQTDTILSRMWKETNSILDTFYSHHNGNLANILNDERFLWKKSNLI